MKRFLVFLSFALVLSGCDRLEGIDSGINGLDNRVKALETRLEQLNREVSLISELLSDKYFVKSVEATDNPVGYKLVLVDKKGNIKEYQVLKGTNGRDGNDGVTPEISVRQDTDGNYYWTVNGEWLLVGEEKVRANGIDGRNGLDGEDGQDGEDGEDGQDGRDGEDGQDGQDGLSPQFKLEGGKWYVRLGSDGDWEYMGEAGSDVPFLITGIDTDSVEGVVVFTLADGTTFALPTAPKGQKLQLIFDAKAFASIEAGKQATTPYKVKAPDGLSYTLDSYEPDGWTVTITKPANNKGNLTIAVPAQASGQGDVFFVVNGADGSCFVALVHVAVSGDEPLQEVEEEYTVDSTAGTLDIPAGATSVEVLEGDDWVTVQGSKFVISENTSYDSREAVVRYTVGNVRYTITIIQAQNDAIVLNASTVEIGAEAGSKLTFIVRANVTVKAVSDAGWLTVDPATKGLVDKSFTFTAQENATGAVRSAKVTFSSGDLSQTVTVNQSFVDVPPPPEPSVTVYTRDATEISYSTALLKGEYADANVSVREVGFEWGTSSSALNEVAQASLQNPSAASGSFSATISGLGDGKTYFYRAYVILQNGTDIRYFYGGVKSFTTPSQPGPQPSGNQPGWAELPVMNYVTSGGYMVDSSDSALYYAWHICPDVNGPGNRKARNYTVCYSADMHCPVWVAAPRHQMYIGNSGRTEAYGKDPDVPANIQYKNKSTGGGCNKGHMLGSAERTVSVETNRQVFYYTNIAPQLSAGFNTGGGGWNTLEDFIDKQVCADTLYEVVGCYFDQFTDGYGNTVTPRTIEFGSRTDVRMPTMFYYVVLRTKSGSSGKSVKNCSASELQCAAFVRAHTNNLKGQKVTSKEMMSVADLEKITGFSYFPNVPNAPKTTFNKSDWGVSQ